MNRESLDQVSNSKALFCLVFVLDSLMAEQQPQNTAIVEEKKVPPTDEVVKDVGDRSLQMICD